MRKRLKNKRRCCGMCKPHKRGGANRWKPKEFLERKRVEKKLIEVNQSTEVEVKHG